MVQIIFPFIKIAVFLVFWPMKVVGRPILKGGCGGKKKARGVSPGLSSIQ